MSRFGRVGFCRCVRRKCSSWRHWILSKERNGDRGMQQPEKSLNPQNTIASLFGARPKLLGAVEHATTAGKTGEKDVAGSNIPAASLGLLAGSVEQVVVMPHIPMSWQGRYRPLDKNCPALLPSAITDIGKEDSEFQLSKVLTRAQQQGIGTEGVHATSSQHEQQAMKILFGEEITQHHITIFTSLKRLMGKWRARAAQRKNIIAVENFATDEIQKRAIIKHKEQAIINLPMPIVWAIKEEVLAVLVDVVKVYRKEFGNGHKLTIDAKKRIDKLKSDLARP